MKTETELTPEEKLLATKEAENPSAGWEQNFLFANAIDKDGQEDVCFEFGNKWDNAEWEW